MKFNSHMSEIDSEVKVDAIAGVAMVGAWVGTLLEFVIPFVSSLMGALVGATIGILAYWLLK